MTYCVESTKLLARAGRTLATALLPKPFGLWYSDHDTGCQMTIVATQPNGSSLKVWRGSIWNSRIYEFNDQDDIPGLQPDFAFAAPVIEKYFSDVREAVEKRDVEHAEQKSAAEAKNVEAKRTAIEDVKQQLVTP